MLSAGMSAVGSLCWVAEDLRSESPMVRLLSLGLRGERDGDSEHEAVPNIWCEEKMKREASVKKR